MAGLPKLQPKKGMLPGLPPKGNASYDVGDVIFATAPPDSRWIPADGMKLSASDYPALSKLFLPLRGAVSTPLASPATLPVAVLSYCADITSDGKYVIVAHNSTINTPLKLYKIVDDVVTYLADTVAVNGTLVALAWSPDTNYLAVITSTGLSIWRRDGDVLTALAAPPALGTGAYQRGVDWSPDSTRLVCLLSTTPFVAVYTRAGDVFTKLVNPLSPMPTAAPVGHSKFSASGNTLVTLFNHTVSVQIYTLTGGVYAEALVLPIGFLGVLPSSIGNVVGEAYRISLHNNTNPSYAQELEKDTAGNYFIRHVTLMSPTGLYGCPVDADQLYAYQYFSAVTPNNTKLYRYTSGEYKKLAEGAAIGFLGSTFGLRVSANNKYAITLDSSTPFIRFYKESPIIQTFWLPNIPPQEGKSQKLNAYIKAKP